MRNIVISDGTNSVTLKSDLIFTLSYEDVSTETVMASGRICIDVVGVRPVLTVPVGWISPADLVVLKNMINTRHILDVTYPSIGGVESGKFIVSQPTYKTCRYTDNGVDIWLGMELTMRGQGVI